jgi:spore coat polysaccharide biosynthesis protein SpsF
MSFTDKPKIGIIILSRFSSNRLPGKALKLIKGKPLLGYIVDRLRAGIPDAHITIATSTEPSDNAIADFAKACGVNCFRGSLENVALRFLQAAETANLDYAVRVTGDSLFIDSQIILDMISKIGENEYVLMSNRKNQMFPVGQTVEIIPVKSYRKYYDLFTTLDDFEHVTHYFYRNELMDKLPMYHHINPDGKFRDISLAIDTPQEFDVAVQIIEALGDRLQHSSYRDVYKLMEKFYPMAGSQSS